MWRECVAPAPLRTIVSSVCTNQHTVGSATLSHHCYERELKLAEPIPPETMRIGGDYALFRFCSHPN